MTSYPEADVTWFREKEPVQTGDSVTTGSAGPGKYHLELQAVQLDDQVGGRPAHSALMVR